MLQIPQIRVERLNSGASLLLGVLVLSFLVATKSNAETIMSCGGTQGWGYSNMNAHPVWSRVDDSIPDGSTTLVSMPQTQEVDILFQDAYGMNSARANGAEVALMDVKNGIANVLAVYYSASGVTIENYVFDANQKVMFVTTTRTLDPSSTLQSKASIRWANCQ